MRKLAKEQISFAAVDHHQFGQSKVVGQPHRVRVGPARDRIKETRQMMHVAAFIFDGLPRLKESAVLLGKRSPVDDLEVCVAHFSVIAWYTASEIFRTVSRW